jgi:hypothetical protein
MKHNLTYFDDYRPSKIELDEVEIAGTHGIDQILPMRDAVTDRLDYFIGTGELVDYSVEHDEIDRKFIFKMKWRKS